MLGKWQSEAFPFFSTTKPKLKKITFVTLSVAYGVAFGQQHPRGRVAGLTEDRTTTHAMHVALVDDAFLDNIFF